MTNPLRLAVLAVFLAFVVPSVPTAATAAPLSCETSKDCPTADICKIKHGHKTGVCVSAKKKKTRS